MAITNGYATLAELKAYLGIADSVDDTMLENIIESASRSIDRIANRKFWLDSVATVRYYRPNNSFTLDVDDIGSTSGIVLQFDTAGDGSYATTLTFNTDYILDPLNSDQKGRPWTIVTLISTSQLFIAPISYRPSVKLTAKWGWPSVPDDINEACLILSADLYKRKDAPGGILCLGDLGVIRMSPLGRDVTAMVRAYRKEVLG